MKDYVFIYYGEPKFKSHEDGAKYMELVTWTQNAYSMLRPSNHVKEADGQRYCLLLSRVKLGATLRENHLPDLPRTQGNRKG